MRNKDIKNVQTILKGEWCFNPHYKTQDVKFYQDNPCIEALPNILEDEEIIAKFKNIPTVDASDRLLKRNTRYHLIKQLKDFVLTLPIHFKAEHMIATMIRRGYVARNPASKEYLSRLRLLANVYNEVSQSKESDTEMACNIMKKSFLDIPATKRSTAESSMQIGYSGMGKSTSIERILMMYPQVIIHDMYKEIPLKRTQIVWVKIDCPHDGSLKTFCKMFFKTLDDILLDTNYLGTFGSNKNSTATMMIHIAHLASLHSIGLLVIDEMQHLINPKNPPDEILNFLVTLINTIGIPVVQIGTTKLLPIVSKSLRQLRRSQDAGSIYWDRMKKGHEWNYFIKVMWKLQWLTEFTPLDEELNNALYEETQGITSFAVALYALVQTQAAFSRTEKITASLIHEVAKSDMMYSQNLIKAIKTNNIDLLMKYEDIKIDFQGIINQRIQKSIEFENVKYFNELINSNQKKEEDISIRIAAEIAGMNIFPRLDDAKLKNIVKDAIKTIGNTNNSNEIKKLALTLALEIDNEKEEKNKNKITNVVSSGKMIKNDLRQIFKKAKKEKILNYDLLKQSGFIAEINDELCM